MTENVLAFTRPPIRQSTTVRAGRERTFDVFLDRLAEWWPLDPFSYGGSARIRTITVDRRVGGEVVEHWHDGETRSWGTLLGYEPPAAVTLTWNITGKPTEIALRFIALDERTTRVDLEHYGWDRLSEAELVEACALPGGYAGGAFDEGWATILTAFKEHLE